MGGCFTKGESAALPAGGTTVASPDMKVPQPESEQLKAEASAAAFDLTKEGEAGLPTLEKEVKTNMPGLDPSGIAISGVDEMKTEAASDVTKDAQGAVQDSPESAAGAAPATGAAASAPAAPDEVSLTGMVQSEVGKMKSDASAAVPQLKDDGEGAISGLAMQAQGAVVATADAAPTSGPAAAAAAAVDEAIQSAVVKEKSEAEEEIDVASVDEKAGMAVKADVAVKEVMSSPAKSSGASKMKKKSKK